MSKLPALSVTITRCKDCPLCRPVQFMGNQCSVTRKFVDKWVWDWPGCTAPADCPLRVPVATIPLMDLPPLSAEEERLLRELPELLELAPRLKARPTQNVFPPACPRCLQRPDQCLCPPQSREEPPF